MSDWTPDALRHQHDHAKQSGLLAKLTAGAKAHALDPAYVVAVASRETGIRNIAGDRAPRHGVPGPWGFGPLQLDKAFHPIPAGWEKDPTEIIARCCVVLVTDLLWAKARMPGDDAGALRVACSAYNAGEGGAWRGHLKGNSDLYTTPPPYAHDVLARMLVYRTLLT